MATIIEQIKTEIERLKSQFIRGACASQLSMQTRCKEDAYNEVLSFLDTLQEPEVLEEHYNKDPCKNCDKYNLDCSCQKKRDWETAKEKIAKPEVDLDFKKEMRIFLEEKGDTYQSVDRGKADEMIAQHFFNLGRQTKPKKIWHDASEEPSVFQKYLVRYSDGRVTGLWERHEDGFIPWKDVVKEHKFTNWCYVDDLITED